MVGIGPSGTAGGPRRRVVAVVGLVACLAGAGACGGGSGGGGAAAGQGGSSGSGGSGGSPAGAGGRGGDTGDTAGSGGGAGTGGSGGTGGGIAGGGGRGGGGTGGGAGAGGTGGGVPVTEIESNDTPGTANDFGAIAVGGRVTAAIGVAGDNDYFSITIPAGTDALYVTTFSAGVDTTCANANTTLALFAADGTTQLASSTNISGTQLCSHISYAPTPGAYFIRVTGNSSSTTTIASYILAVRAETLPAPTPETEPNDDGTPSIGNGMNTAEGNDFSSAAANGPYSADTLITGALDPAGDEDVFAIQNPGTTPAEVYLETFNGGFGACTGGLDTQLRIRDAAGTVLAFDDDASMGRFCSFLPYIIPPATTVYAHVIDFGDNTAAPAYSLHVSFP
jgi:hypothetical protein